MVKRTILCKLGDNDFHCTFRSLLQTVQNLFQWHTIPEYHGTIDGIEEKWLEGIMRQMIPSHYTAFQVGPERRRLTSQIGNEKTFKYLERVKIFFDDEAEAIIQEDNWDTGSWYLELQSGRIEYL